MTLIEHRSWTDDKNNIRIETTGKLNIFKVSITLTWDRSWHGKGYKDIDATVEASSPEEALIKAPQAFYDSVAQWKKPEPQYLIDSDEPPPLSRNSTLKYFQEMIDDQKEKNGK